MKVAHVTTGLEELLTSKSRSYGLKSVRVAELVRRDFAKYAYPRYM